ncbi:uncharacterized protein LOC135224655 [Macrobrachium nipponense]|uniref:uncharacterized protein LOC135224655 n=1 Tax=Macrobrachium nipponense TaxID=159736 RepID=UPI0030C87D01
MMEAPKFKCRRDQRPLNIGVEIDNGVTTSSCYVMLENLLKYVLYQRYQIPMAYEMLLKTAAKLEGGCGDQTLPEGPVGEGEAKEGNNSKAEVLQQKKERKTKLWLLKAKKFIEDFRQVTKTLQEQLESGDISVVNFVLGVSVASGHELYSVILPRNIRVAQSDKSTERHIAMQLFRAFSSHENILKHMDRPCGVKKMWVMFQKSQKVPPSGDNWFSNTSPSSPVDDHTSSMFVPLPHFQPCHRTKVVHINIHTPPVELSMELTPSVGKGLINYVSTPFMKAQTKQSLRFNIPTVTPKSCANSSHYAVLHCTCYSPEMSEELFHSVCKMCGLKGQGKPVHSNDESYANSLPVASHTPNVKTPNVKVLPSKKFPVSMLETPTVSSVLRVNHFNVQNSPSRFLVSKIDQFSLCENDTDNADVDNLNINNTDGKVWYLIDQSITGFKDTLWKKYKM